MTIAIAIITISAIGIIGGIVINKMIDREVARGQASPLWVALATVASFTVVPAVALVALVA